MPKKGEYIISYALEAMGMKLYALTNQSSSRNVKLLTQLLTFRTKQM